MRICLVSPGLTGEFHAGFVTSMSSLAVGLRDRGHVVHVVCRPTDARLPGVLVHPVDPNPPSLALLKGVGVAPELMHASAVHRQVRRIHQVAGLDAVLVAAWNIEGLLCVLDHGLPTILTCMTTMETMLDLYGSWRSLDRPLALHRLERALVTRARYLHGLTQSALRDCLEQYGSTPRLRIVLGRGLLDRSHGATSPDARPIDPAATVELLFVGRLEHRKGVDVLLEAAMSLAREGLPLRLRLAGRDTNDTDTGESYRARFERQFEGVDAARCVEFLGPVSDDRRDQLYREADIVCQPSRYESHGVVLVEAMMFGKAVVSCIAGGIPEVLSDGRDAVLVPPGDPRALADALRRLILDATFRARLAAAARRRYEQTYDAAITAGAMSEFMSAVARDHTQSASENPPADLEERLQDVLVEALDFHPRRARDVARALGIPSSCGPAPAPTGATADEIALAAQAWQELGILFERRLVHTERLRQMWAERAAQLDQIARSAQEQALAHR